MINILVVEDSIAVRNRLREVLREMRQFRIMGEYDTADDAIAAIQSETPHVVLLDIKLRVGNGMDVLRHVKQTAPGATVIVFSQHDEIEYRERFTQAGADFYFNKTRESAKLVATLERLASL